MKTLFVGLGSIARRHIKNLRYICDEAGEELTIDAYRHRCGEEAEDDICSSFFDMEEVPDDYDMVFITNPTHLHLEALRQVHGKGRGIFIEKPVVTARQLDEAWRFSRREDAVYYVACPLRYNAVIQYIHDNVNPCEIISVRSICSSYLPEWRKDTDYRESYSAHRSMGGGVDLDLIHEWDYLTYILGFPDSVCCIRGKKSDLEIDSDDYALYMAEYTGQVLELHLDYFGRYPVRKVEIITSRDTIIGDIKDSRLYFMKEGREIDFGEQRDDYQRRELKHFIDMVNTNINNDEYFEHALKVLELTQGVIPAA